MSVRLFNSINATAAGRELFDYVFDDNRNWGISADVDASCLCCGGDTYELLARIIPKNRAVYDFGAAYGFQSWYFRHHKRYIGVNPGYRTRPSTPFRTDNSIWFEGTIQDFFSQFSVEDDSFAICNYVPDEAAKQLVRENCPHLFVNYVTDGDCRRIFKERKNDKL